MGNKLKILFLTFLKIGAFTFGGGYAMIPLIQHEVVEKKAYITETEFMNIIAIAEATPGVIAVNMATFVGYQTAGLIGGLIATMGVVLPSFVIITLVSWFYTAFRAVEWVDWAFSGIRAGVIVLVIGAFVKLFKQNERNGFVFLLMGMAFVIAAFTYVNIAWLILFGAVTGIAFQTLRCRRKGVKDDHLS